MTTAVVTVPPSSQAAGAGSQETRQSLASFFFSSRRRHTRCSRDWSSDVCSSDLHPILLPGNPTAGSCVMVADPGAAKSCYSVNHGAGRAKGRKAAIRELDQQTVDDEFTASDILTNCRFYPKDEAPAAYKDFNEVLRSVERAGLASEVARLRARFVIKDSDESLKGAA